MIKTVFAVLITLCLAIGGGAASLAYVLDDARGAGALTLGEWTAYPKTGSPEADPYARARTAREGILALGAAEGVAFTAVRDSSGAPLRLDCVYNIEGMAPPGRFWTLFAAVGPEAVKNQSGRPSAINSQNLLRNGEGRYIITVGRRPAPGNWIGVTGEGAMQLVMTVYDSSLSTGTEIGDVSMPEIIQAGCNV